MAVDIRVTGAEQLRALARDVRAAGDKGIRREMYRGIQRATKPLKAAAQASALEHLPAGGGLNRRVAGARMSTRTRTGGANPGVRIVAREGKASIDLAALDRGRLRHPLYGNRRYWYLQRVPDGWWSRPMTQGADTVRRELVAALDDVRRQLAGR